MSTIFRRSVTTLIPPKIASPANLGSNPAAKRMQHIVAFYSKLPRGNATVEAPRTPFAIYRETYRNKGSPVLHFALGFLFLGYGLEYYFHLSHEKEHH
jgi:F-type H+-transporting ATPase subunit f